MIDTHSHIDTDAFDPDRSEMLKQAFESGVEAIIIPAIEPNTFERVLKTVSEYDNIYCAIGVHPHNAGDINEEVLGKIEDVAINNPKAVAIGEIGLDYYYDFAPKEIQKISFAKQIKIAQKLDLPVIVHNRDSDDDLLDILQSEQNGNLKGVLHCFSSTIEFARKALDLGFHISFTGNITFKKMQELTEVVSYVPLDRILLETDSPYMTPVPFRGKRNEPKYVRLVAEKIAEIKSKTIDEVIKMTTNNSKKLFKLFGLSILLMLFCLPVFSQTLDSDDETELYNPYEKFIGFGGFLGLNTIVDTQYLTVGEKDVTYEGISAFGGAVTYGALDFLNVEFAFMSAKNKKIAEDALRADPPLVRGPNKHDVYELSFHFTPNPYSRVNVFGTIGITYFNNIYSMGDTTELRNNQFGINTGVGFVGNIPIKGAGLFTITAQWRLNFKFGKNKAIEYNVVEVDDPNNPGKKIKQYVPYEIDISTFFSIPRIGIFWYPPFKEWFGSK